MIRGIVGTGGHIDHGKTALIGALTGIDTDRLPEERQRGISIDLGFSHLDVEGGALGIVDVPGHEDFIRNMVAGATGIDLLLLVVAADEGVMPQTREHVAIAELLDVPAAVVALTKTDLVDDDWLALAADDARQFLATTAFADAPILPVSSTTGAGLDTLRSAIAEATVERRGEADDLFRLPVDRGFTVRGTGTVVTGTVWSGSLAREARVRLLPGDLEARVRGLQVHGRDVERVEAGQRAAVALAGLDRQAVERGMTVVTDDAWTATSILTVRIRALPATGWGVEHRQRVRLHVGTAEVMARVALLDAERLGEGESGWAQLRLESPLVARTRDRFVLRSYSPVTTIGGGVVTEARAPKRKRLADADRALLDALAGAAGRRTGGVDPAEPVVRLLESASGRGVGVADLPVDAGVSPAAVARALRGAGAAIAGDRAFGDRALARLMDDLSAAVDAHHRARPLQPGIDPAELRRAAEAGTDPSLVALALERLLEEGRLAMRSGRVAAPSFRPTLSPAQEVVRSEVRAALAEDRSEPPRLDALRDRVDADDELMDLLELMESEGELVRVDTDLFMERAEIDRLAADVRRRLGGKSGLSPSAFREVIPLSRRHLIPILEHLDREGVTLRTGDGRSVPVAR